MKPETLSFAVLAICAALVCSTNAADAQTGLRPITARWWQWVLSIPADNNPTLDTTGQDCMVGQQGPIWLCAVTRRRFPVGASPTRRFAPAGSNRSSHGGNEMAGVFDYRETSWGQRDGA